MGIVQVKYFGIGSENFGQIIGMSTYLSLHYHIIFGTKDRSACLVEAWRSRLHDYLGGTVNGLGGHCECVGGVGDHVHLLIGLRATNCLADVVREVKKSSSAWIRSEASLRSFKWQDGYSAFTVSASSVPSVKRYISTQEEHHRVKSFREEWIEMLSRAGVGFDPKFID